MLIPVKGPGRRNVTRGRWTVVRSMFTGRRFLRLGYYYSAHDSCAVLLWNDKRSPKKQMGRTKFEWHIQCQGPEFSQKITFEKSGFLSGADADIDQLASRAMQAAERDFDAAMKKYDKKSRKK